MLIKIEYFLLPNTNRLNTVTIIHRWGRYWDEPTLGPESGPG